ncbi:hypothetical protein G8A07_15645 [Roseateles sp. DAIF2]|nr:hypothetical protein [Roseateles sp. DAIF2]QPF74209.1 hypothetical protein G8A07_15645 [Roseateles sp. DAIF2]
MFLITITMGDGSRGEHRGEYLDAFAAVEFARQQFPQARSIDVEPIKS